MLLLDKRRPARNWIFINLSFIFQFILLTGGAYAPYAPCLEPPLIKSLLPSDLATLSDCADTVMGWHIANNLLLNTSKTEALVTGTRQQIAKLDQTGGIVVSGSIVPFAAKPHVLGVTLDSYLSLDDHVTVAVRACNYHLHALRHIRPLITRDATNTIACSIVCSWLDYCNIILYGVSDYNISRLQRVQNALARTVCATSYRSSATDLRRSLHRLPVQQRIAYKIAMTTFKARHHKQPAYLSQLIIDYHPSRPLRSMGNYLITIRRGHYVQWARTCSSSPDRELRPQVEHSV